MAIDVFNRHCRTRTCYLIALLFYATFSMSYIDWCVLGLTLLGIVVYGTWKSRHTNDIDGFFRANRQLPWYHVGLSVMATQASAITFLSGPGLGYSDGMRFVQFYFGLPLAMVIICVAFVPIFHKLNVYTAYEYLEKRFDNKTRTLTAILFLVQRGISTGITIYAPAIVMSVILGIDIVYTILFNGFVVIAYTVYGGTRAVSFTQVLQMAVIFSGLIMAAVLVVHMLPANVGFADALHIAGKMNHTNALSTKFDINDRYNIWSGLIGGLFLQLSYFGTDQSQVGRYLTGESVSQSRMGLIMNGLVKIPMQFFILMIGILVFTFYQFNPSPLFFNKAVVEKLEKSEGKQQLHDLEDKHGKVQAEKLSEVNKLVDALHTGNEANVDEARRSLKILESRDTALKNQLKRLIRTSAKGSDDNDSNYVFLVFVTKYFPVGMVGLLIAIIFLAAMGSTASGLNSLASTTIVDLYKRIYRKDVEDRNYLKASRWATVGWGIFCILAAMLASRLGKNLMEAVNELGSYFYGTILGIFLVAFCLKRVGGTAVFIAALISELALVGTSISMPKMSFLWFNVIACGFVMVMSLIIQQIIQHKKTRP